MPWRPLPRIAFAIAVFPFQPDAPADLPLELGDELYIIEEGGINGAWLRGYLVAPPSLLSGLTSTKGQTLEARVFSGIFPRSCVEIREYIGGETDVLPALTDSEHSGTNGQHDVGHSPHAGPDSRHQTAPASSDSQWTHIDATGHSPGLEAKDGSSSMTGPGTPTSFVPREGKAPRPPAPVPMLKIGDETPTCANEPLVDEIASCLREWHSTNLHELLLSRQYPKLAKLTRLMNRLDMARRQLLHGVLTAQEVVELHEKVVWDMVKGNKLVNDEIIIRDPKQRGRLLTAKDSIFEITKLTANMALLDQPPKPIPDPVNLHHLLVDVRGVVSNLGSITPQLLMYVYRKVPGENPQRLTESFSTEPPDEKKKNQSKARTLFTELTALDVGELSGSDAELFLVIKVQAKQDVVTNPPPSRAGPPNNRQSSLLMSNLQQNGMESGTKPSLPQLASKASRRSLLWGANRIAAQRKRFAPQTIDENPSSASLSSENDTYRPSTATTSSTTQPPQSVTGPSETEKPKPKQTAHRDLGVAVLKLKDILSETGQTEETVTVWSPSDSGFRTAEQEDWNPIIPEVMQSLTGKFEECVQVTQIHLHARSFVSPDVDELIRRTPTALLNVHKTPKIGFPGAPKEPRSDIYITVTEPNISLLAQFSHPERGMQQLQDGIDKQNLQLTMEVRKDNGQRVEHCIYPTSNSPGVTAWRTTAIRRGQAWKQTIRLAIPSEDVPHCHIIMSIADAPNFPFALAWMPLWSNGAFIEDGRHLPLLYIYDKITSRQANGRGAYLDMPWDSRPNTGSRSMDASGNTATLSIETFLCSTELTQDQVLLGILNWKQHHAEQLSVSLRQLSFVPDIELVKLTTEVFTAMFGILTDKAGQEEFEDLILSNLVTVLGISRDRRFNKEPVVEKYIESTFDFPHVSNPILRSLQRLFTRTTDYQNSRHLNSTIKSANMLLRFVAKSRKQRQAQEASIGITNGNGSSNAFFEEIEKLFKSFQGLMRNTSPALVGSKTLLMQHVTPLLETLGPCADHNRLWLCGWDFVDSTNNVQGKLQLHRLAMILDNAKALETYRLKYLGQGIDLEPSYQKFADWISPFWGATNEVTDQYREQVRLCVGIVTVRENGYGLQADIYKTKLLDTYICLRDAGRPYKSTFSPLFTHAYPTTTKPLGHECPVDEALMEVTAALTEYKDVPLDPALYPPERLMIHYEVIRSIIIGESNPRSWLTLSLVHHRGALLSVQKQFTFLKKHYLPPPEEAGEFRTDLWRSLFMTLLAIIGSDNLALETFPEQKRRAVWKIAGDVREVGAGLLARCWNAIGWETDNDEKEQYGLDRLGGYQVQYVPNLVGPIVELCLSVHAGLRATAVQILQSMIISEWTLNGDLGAIQHEIIDNLDYLLKNKNVAENAQQKLFIIELMDLFEPLAETSDNELWEAFKDLISVVEDLLDLLIVVHNPETSDAFRTMNTLRLMDFLREMQKEDIFISYVHQLADSEAQSRCYKEAGLALRLHADLYDWNTNKTTEALKNPYFPAQTHFERKEALYFEMIKHFEEGAAYSCVLECYRELADHYEHTSFDFFKLARSQRSMAKVYDLISRGEGQTPRYFRVVYKGLSFPPSLRDKQFVFEGNGAERLITFTDRLQREHPQAQLASTNDNVEGEGQFLLVTPVTPYRDLKHPLYQRTKVGFATKEYVLSASPVNFAVTTKRHSPKTGVKDQWVEKTVYTTAEVFPTILRRSEIIAEEVLPLSPDQTAIERTVRKTSELWTLEKRIREGDEQSNWSLIEAIKASTDERSSTSVAQYREMLPKKDESETSGHGRTKEDPMKTGLQIALLDFTSTLRHCLNTFSKTMPLADFQKLQSQFQTTFAPELAALQPAQGADSALALFTDPTFQVNPPTPKAKGFSLDTTRSEAEDVLPETTSRPKPVLNSERSRGNRLSALLKRKPSTANSNDTGPSGGFSQANGYGFGKGKTGTSGTNSSSAVNEAHGGRNADVMSSKSSNRASIPRGQKITTSTFPRPGTEMDDQGGPVYTAITSAKDAFRNRDGRPTTSNSNGTVTTTGRRVAALRKRLSARKLGFGSDGQSDVQRWGDGDAMAVRVEVLQ